MIFLLMTMTTMVMIMLLLLHIHPIVYVTSIVLYGKDFSKKSKISIRKWKEKSLLGKWAIIFEHFTIMFELIKKNKITIMFEQSWRKARWFSLTRTEFFLPVILWFVPNRCYLKWSKLGLAFFFSPHKKELVFMPYCIAFSYWFII